MVAYEEELFAKVAFFLSEMVIRAAAWWRDCLKAVCPNDACSSGTGSRRCGVSGDAHKRTSSEGASKVLVEIALFIVKTATPRCADQFSWLLRGRSERNINFTRLIPVSASSERGLFVGEKCKVVFMSLHASWKIFAVNSLPGSVWMM